MSYTAVAAYFLQSLDVHLDFAFQIAFDHDVVVVDVLTNLVYFLIGQIPNSCIGIDTCISENLVGRNSTDTIDIGKSDFHSFLIWQIYATNTSH